MQAQTYSPTIDPDIARILDAAMAEAWQVAHAEITAINTWPTVYINSDTGRTYVPHSDEERDFVYCDEPRFPLATGGEGAGKTVSGAIKALNRIRRGMSGIAVSPTLPHFASSTWAELRRWIPWQCVMPSDQYMQAATWMPTQQFELVFNLPGYPKLQCGGLVDSAGRAVKWEGPNVHFFWFDEARRAPNSNGLKVLTGRPRLTGPGGEPPQGWITTTGGCTWLTEYYGPLKENDKRADFKALTKVIQLLTKDNTANLDPDYAIARFAVFDNETETAIYSGVDPWGEIADFPFLENIELWDRLVEPDLPVLTKREPIAIALDAGETSDSFALVGVGMHPKRTRGSVRTAVRFAYEWKPEDYGGSLNFGEWDSPDRTLPIPTLYDLCKVYNVLQTVYDNHQLHQPVKSLEGRARTWFKKFNQQDDRLVADNDLRLVILNAGTSHNGTLANLRKHLANANRKTYESDGNGRKIRIVKRGSLKVDLAVALSMAHSALLSLNL